MVEELKEATIPVAFLSDSLHDLVTDEVFIYETSYAGKTVTMTTDLKDISQRLSHKTLRSDDIEEGYGLEPITDDYNEWMQEMNSRINDYHIIPECIKYSTEAFSLHVEDQDSQFASLKALANFVNYNHKICSTTCQTMNV